MSPAPSPTLTVMSTRWRVALPMLLAVAVVGTAVALSGGTWLGHDRGPNGTPATGLDGSGNPLRPSGGLPIDPAIEPDPTPRPPLGGTELYGYLPYWQMTDAVATHLRATPLSTIGLFSVTARRNGAINTGPAGYRRITGDIGRRLIDEAHDRDVRVELVFTSFGAERNGILFGRIPRATPSAAPTAAAPTTGVVPAPPWRRTVSELVALVVDLGVDGLNVDVELLDEADRPAYGSFLSALDAALAEADPDLSLSVATEAGPRGIGNAAVAIDAGVDRVFLMGYDYHWSGSPPGATAPIDRVDGLYTLRWSIDRYVEAGVPRDRILLGLPLYGMQWRTLGPDRTAPVVGKGVTWIPRNNLGVLLADGFAAGRDLLEHAEFFVVPDGDTWLVTYFDSPATLRPKLALARDNGLAGAGFWALGYERGLPGYRELMTDFRDGKVAREEAPSRP